MIWDNINNGASLDDPTADRVRYAFGDVNDFNTWVSTLLNNGIRKHEVILQFASSSGSLEVQTVNVINAAGTFSIAPNRIGIISFFNFLPTGGYIKQSWLINAGTFGVGGTQITTGDIFRLAPVEVLPDPAFTYDLGNIVSAEIWDFVNGSGPYAAEGLTIFTATQDGNEMTWIFSGGNGTFGDGATQTTADDFIDITNQDPLPAPSVNYLKAQVISDNPFTPDYRAFNRTITLTANDVTVDFISTIKDDCLDAGLTSIWIRLHFTGTGTHTLSLPDDSEHNFSQNEYCWVECFDIDTDEWVVRRWFGSINDVSGTLHNTIIGGVGATINTKALLAEQLTGASANDISNFYLIGNDIYAQINNNYVIGANINTVLGGTNVITKWVDYDGRMTPNTSNVVNSQTEITQWFLPGLKTNGSGSFSVQTSLKDFIANNILRVSGVAGFLSSCPELEIIEMDSLDEISIINFTNSFSSLPNLLKINFPSLRTIVRGNASTGNLFTGINACTEVFLPFLESINVTNGIITMFTGIGGNLIRFYGPNLKFIHEDAVGFTAIQHAGCTITVHSDLSTANNGEEHSVLAAARAAGATIVYHQTDRWSKYPESQASGLPGEKFLNTDDNDRATVDGKGLAYVDDIESHTIKSTDSKGFIAKNDNDDVLARMFNDDGNEGSIEIYNILTGNSLFLRVKSELSTTVITLSNILGNYNSTPSWNATYTTSGSVAGGNATLLIDTTGEASFPSVTGATLVTGSDFEADAIFEMHVYTLDGVDVRYYFLYLEPA